MRTQDAPRAGAEGTWGGGDGLLPPQRSMTDEERAAYRAFVRRQARPVDERAGADAEAPGEALSLIAAERRRQVEQERWTEQHDDDEHPDGELARAAACYALPMPWRVPRRVDLALLWPWAVKWWKPARTDAPADRLRELTKAGALIVAEMERLQRAARAAERAE